MIPTRNQFQIKQKNQIEEKLWKRVYQANINQKKVGVTILILHKVEFRAKRIIRDRGTLHNDERVNAPKRCNDPKHLHTIIRTGKYVKQKLKEGNEK